MDVVFRELDPFNCWIWIRFGEPPSEGERNYINGVFESWYVLGRLGGFNAENLQAHDSGGELSWMPYENDSNKNCLPALMHNMSEFEYLGYWSRCWVDLGTSDSFALDVLINSLKQIDIDIVNIVELRIGGLNEDWPIEEGDNSIFSSIQ